MARKLAPALRWSAVLMVALPLAKAAAEPAAAAPATAPPRRSHRLVISLERLFGFEHESRTETPAGFTVAAYSAETTTVSFFGNQPGGTSTFSPFTFPRLAADVILGDHFTLGTVGGYYHTSTALGANGELTQSGYLVGLRAGFLFRLGHDLALWPRAGVTFAHTFESGSFPNALIVDLTAPTLEAPLLFSVSPHLACSLALTIEPISAGTFRDQHDYAYDLSITDVGLQAGISVLF